ncbi:response regulator [Candidatus Saccharibacteria bacterium]|nr:response regulator [Candidatus Saccharibacteria bacterium]
MTKVMLVEDDKSLREIYSIRLVAEGYEVVSAGDGEEALAMAVKERPDLIVSDVMMPKISGFDMLDILRSTPETKDIKVIMMTALSSEDQRQRGESLGANKYLVKSQVGIEDVINAVHEVLDGGDASAEASPSSEDALLSRGTSSTAPSGAPSSSDTPPADVSPVSVSPAVQPEAAPAASPVVEPVVPAAQPAETAPQPATQSAEAQPAQPVQNATGAAMDQLLNEAPAQDAAWPGTASQ